MLLALAGQLAYYFIFLGQRRTLVGALYFAVIRLPALAMLRQIIRQISSIVAFNELRWFETDWLGQTEMTCITSRSSRVTIVFVILFS
ncbi:unnamed protein product [Ectocarpus sp. 12 AP-2014]